MGIETKYFVLKPRGDNEWAAASRKAMRAYARHIQGIDPELAESLLSWANSESKVALDKLREVSDE